MNSLLRNSKDIIKIKKQDDSIIENVRALVQPNTIFIPDSSLLIEEGDLIIRPLSNGSIEEYEVIDRGFYEKISSFPAHYQCKVRKTSIKHESASQVTNNITFNGPNARYNNNSTDNSTNVVNDSSTLFDEIRKVIEKSVDTEQRTVIIEMVNEMEKSKGTSSFKDKYANFIQSLGNHIAVVSPFIPQLTELLI